MRRKSEDSHMRRIYWILPVVILICLIPVFLVYWSSWFAARHGCVLHEGWTNPCIVDGHDWGDTLSSAFVSGWFALATLPVAFGCVLVLAVLALTDLSRHIRSRQKD